MRLSGWVWVPLLVTACGGEPPASPPAEVESSELRVHEWGTFTSVQSSAGVPLEGLHHEEEALPAFVYGRGTLPSESAAPARTKGMESHPFGVTQKLETPVLYFHTPRALGVRVTVDFPEGVVSEWYPNATSFLPELGSVERPSGGRMEWLAELSPGLPPSDFLAVAPNEIWAPSRRVSSTPVSVGAESEQFIFYRGLGAFRLPLEVTVAADGLVSVHNPATEASPAVFLLRVHAEGGALVELGPLAPGATLRAPTPVEGKELDLDAFVVRASGQIASALERTGLYADEARAMVDTWSQGYFKSYGLRLLYVVPRAWTDALLPITIDPRPTELVRTLVGRVELLAPSEELELARRVSDAAARGRAASELITELGRLAEPKLRRALELSSDEAVRAWCAAAVATAAEMP